MTIPHVSADRLVLASASPRRRELLRRLGVAFEVVRPTSTRRRWPARRRRPRPAAGRGQGAAVAVDAADAVVLAADTVVEVDGEILGKPADADDARPDAARRSPGAPTWCTPAWPSRPDGRLVDVEVVTTIVTFAPLTDEAIEWYVGTGEPFDKAGAYAIQGAGGVFVERIDGSVSNVSACR